MTRPSDSQQAAELALAVLPTLDDLLGEGWLVDPGADAEDDADELDGGGFGLPDGCLPGEFPDQAVVDGAEVAFVRPERAGVYAMSTVFGDAASASTAWSVLGRADFVRCFVASVAAEVDTLGRAELLGPVMRGAEPPNTTARNTGARRGVVASVALFSSIDQRAVTPVALRIAVIGARTSVVVLWSVDRGELDDDLGWDHVVERVADRCLRASG